MRVRDLGLPIGDSGRRGDLYIKLIVELPDFDHLVSDKFLHQHKIHTIQHSHPAKFIESEKANNYICLPCEVVKNEIKQRIEILF